MFVLQVIFYVIFVYGLLSLVQDIGNEITYKKISCDMKIVLFAKKLEENIDKFIIELYNIKRLNSYKQVIVVDLEKNDDISKIRERINSNGINVEILSFKEGENYINDLLY